MRNLQEIMQSQRELTHNMRTFPSLFDTMEKINKEFEAEAERIIEKHEQQQAYYRQLIRKGTSI